ncbi:MAG: hypothetical protein Q8L89_08625 [Gammaproteobacteria bacterium]|nr:hypothetical protein [Gammaproteobacteria bacterium]
MNKIIFAVICGAARNAVTGVGPEICSNAGQKLAFVAKGNAIMVPAYVANIGTS